LPVGNFTDYGADATGIRRGQGSPPRWGRFSGCGMRPEPRPHGALPLEQDSGPPKQRAEFYVARLIRADPVTVESVGDASLELNQRRRARLDIGRVEHRKIAAVLPRPPDHRQQPTLAFGSIVAAFNKHRLGDGIACLQLILAATRTAGFC
jgi:hypothetical protein